jgi:acetamidase/formamidase
MRRFVIVGLFALLMLAFGAAPAMMQTAMALELEPIDYTGLQVVNGRDVPPKGAKHYQADKRHTPAIRVKPGEKFVIITEDNTDGQFLVDGHYKTIPKYELEVFHHTPPNFNPSAGPVYIEGCTKNDVVAVHIHSVKPEAEGYTARYPNDVREAYLLRKYPQLDPPSIHAIKHLPGPSGTTRDGVAVYGKYTWELDPYPGTLTLAPEREVQSFLLVRGPYGGNLDVRDFKQGSTVYLNSYNEGGLLYAGDCHASQADTEFHGLADECRAEYVLSVELIKNKRLPNPRIKTRDGRLVALCERGFTQQAIGEARWNLFDWLVEDYGCDPADLYALMAAAEPFRVEFYQGPGPGAWWGVQTVGVSVPESFILGKRWKRMP